MGVKVTFPPGSQAKIAGLVSTLVKREIAPALAKEIAARAPGSLAQKVQIRPTALGAEVGFFGDDFKKALFVSGGVQPHRIPLSGTKTMAFFWDKVGMQTIVPGKPVRHTGPRRGIFWIGKGFVNHPGYEGNDFIREALAALGASSRFFRGAGGRFVSGR